MIGKGQKALNMFCGAINVSNGMRFSFINLSDDQVKSYTGLKKPTFQEIVARICLSSGILIWEDSHINKQRRSVPDISCEAAG